jgi:hypothetical protein
MNASGDPAPWPADGWIASNSKAEPADCPSAAHPFGYALGYGIGDLEVSRPPGDGCRNPGCQRVDSDHVRAWTHAHIQHGASTQSPSDCGPADVRWKAAHVGAQMLPFEQIDNDPRPAGLEQGQAAR